MLIDLACYVLIFINIKFDQIVDVVLKERAIWWELVAIVQRPLTKELYIFWYF